MNKKAVIDNVQKELFAMQDIGYRDFHMKLMPTVDPERVIGVRTPALRAFAKKYGKTEEAKQLVADGGYEPMYGARPLKRYLQKNVETLAARLILEGNVGTGDIIVLDVKDGHLEAHSEHEA